MALSFAIHQTIISDINNNPLLASLIGPWQVVPPRVNVDRGLLARKKSSICGKPGFSIFNSCLHQTSNS